MSTAENFCSFLPKCESFPTNHGLANQQYKSTKCYSKSCTMNSIFHVKIFNAFQYMVAYGKIAFLDNWQKIDMILPCLKVEWTHKWSSQCELVFADTRVIITVITQRGAILLTCHDTLKACLRTSIGVWMIMFNTCKEWWYVLTLPAAAITSLKRWLQAHLMRLTTLFDPLHSYDPMADCDILWGQSWYIKSEIIKGTSPNVDFLIEHHVMSLEVKHGNVKCATCLVRNAHGHNQRPGDPWT